MTTWTRDHPRVSGEHVFFHGGLSMYQGSSPRERGARRTAGRQSGQPGIIPA